MIFLTFFSTPQLAYVLALSLYLWSIVRSYGKKPGKMVSHPSEEVSVVYRVTVKHEIAVIKTRHIQVALFFWPKNLWATIISDFAEWKDQGAQYFL